MRAVLCIGEVRGDCTVLYCIPLRKPAPPTSSPTPTCAHSRPPPYLVAHIPDTHTLVPPASNLAAVGAEAAGVDAGAMATQHAGGGRGGRAEVREEGGKGQERGST